VVVGLIGGVLSGFFGVGGGVIMIPLMVSVLAIPQHRAHGTSLTVIIPTAVVGAITYFVSPHEGQTSAQTVALYTLAFAVPAMLGAPLGVKVIHRIDTASLKRLFGIMILALAVQLLIPRSATTTVCDMLGVGGVSGCPSLTLTGTLITTAGLVVMSVGAAVIVVRGPRGERVQ
jgi:hypothetical protein